LSIHFVDALDKGSDMHFPDPTHAANAKKWVLLGAVLLAALSMPLSFTGPAVALPAIGQSLGGSPVALNWVTNAFMLGFGGCLMAAGALADQFGRRRLFVLGVGGFAAASLALVFVPDIVWLDALRAVQGVAGAAAFAGGAAALAQEFDGHARARAFSLLGTTFGVGLAFGPVLSGLLIERLGWRSVFLSATVLGALALLCGWRGMPESRDPEAQGLDWLGALGFTAALTLFTYALLQVPEHGWGDRRVACLLAAAAALLAAFVLIETRAKRPMLDLSLFRYPRFVGVQFLAAAPAYCYVVLQVLLPARFIGIEGYSALAAGRMMIALSAPMLIVPILAGMLTRWLSAGLISGIGLLTAAGGLAWLAQCTPGQPAAHWLAPLLVIGLGTSLPWGLMDGLAVSVVPKERAGMAMGIFSTTRVAGEGVALAVVAAMLAGLVQSRLRDVGPADLAHALPEAAQRLAMGDLAHAGSVLPGIDQALLVHGYGDAFRILLYILSAITVLSSGMVFGLLTHRPAQEAASEPAPQPWPDTAWGGGPAPLPARKAMGELAPRRGRKAASAMSNDV
jgi:MFS family permease